MILIIDQAVVDTVTTPPFSVTPSDVIVPVILAIFTADVLYTAYNALLVLACISTR